MEDIHDIKGPLELTFNYWPIIILFTVLCLTIFLLIYFSLKRREPVLPPETGNVSDPLKLSPVAAALKELEKVKKERLIELNKTDVFYNRITEILKKYLSGQYDTEVDSKTSLEIIMRLKNLNLDYDLVRQIELCLKDLDFAKYSSYKTNAKDMTESLELISALFKLESRLHL